MQGVKGMQVYVSKGGQQYGPYTVGEVRQYVEAGNFAPTDHACCDGANVRACFRPLNEK